MNFEEIKNKISDIRNTQEYKIISARYDMLLMELGSIENDDVVALVILAMNEC